MNKNIWLLFISSSVFSLCFGMYDFAFPLYLTHLKISFEVMGYIFAISTILIFIIRIYVGRAADTIGRKFFYSLAIISSSVANIFTPIFNTSFFWILTKSVRETAAVIREIMRSVLLYENNRGQFLKFIARNNGLEFFWQGIGTMFAGLMIGLIGYWSPFILSAILLIITYFIFDRRFNEQKTCNRTNGKIRFDLNEILTLNIPSKLKVIAITYFFITMGVSVSHCFIMPIFFKEKFGLNVTIVATILALHRFSLGIPMFIVGHFIKENLKVIYILTVAIEGITIILGGIISNVWIAVSVWLLHDIIGASFWVPIQNTLIQEHSREERRAEDLSIVTAFAAIGGVIGPLIAGWLSGISISMPFIGSGIIIILGSFVLLKL